MCRRTLEQRLAAGQRHVLHSCQSSSCANTLQSSVQLQYSCSLVHPTLDTQDQQSSSIVHPLGQSQCLQPLDTQDQQSSFVVHPTLGRSQVQSNAQLPVIVFAQTHSRAALSCHQSSCVDALQSSAQLPVNLLCQRTPEQRSASIDHRVQTHSRAALSCQSTSCVSAL
jgi:hypothetical protein